MIHVVATNLMCQREPTVRQATYLVPPLAHHHHCKTTLFFTKREDRCLQPQLVILEPYKYMTLMTEIHFICRRYLLCCFLCYYVAQVYYCKKFSLIKAGKAESSGSTTKFQLRSRITPFYIDVNCFGIEKHYQNHICSTEAAYQETF